MNSCDYTKLHRACRAGKLNEVATLLQDQAFRSQIDTSDGFLGYAPLHEAVIARKPEIIEQLLKCGANINVQAHGNYTPLHIAASIDAYECINVLLHHGADVNLVDDFRKTPYRTAVVSCCYNASRRLYNEGIFPLCLKV